VPRQLLLERPDEIVKKMQVLGADLAIYAYPAGVDLASQRQ
jgi:hypothetical protein